MTARKRLLNHGGHELVTFEQGALAPPTLADVYAAHDSANRGLYLKRRGRMPAGGSTLGTTSADAYARGHSAGDVGLDAQVKGKATRALPNMKGNRDG
jgi:hypothetical protein